MQNVCVQRKIGIGCTLLTASCRPTYMRREEEGKAASLLAHQHMAVDVLYGREAPAPLAEAQHAAFANVVNPWVTTPLHACAPQP